MDRFPDTFIPLHPQHVATAPGPCSVIWNPGLMQQYSGVVQYDGWDGKPHYQCATCYQHSLTAAASNMPMSMPPKVEPPPTTTCCSCEVVIRP